MERESWRAREKESVGESKSVGERERGRARVWEGESM